MYGGKQGIQEGKKGVNYTITGGFSVKDLSKTRCNKMRLFL